MNSRPGSNPLELGSVTFPGARHVGMGDLFGGDGNDELVVANNTVAGNRIDAYSGTGRQLFSVDAGPFGGVSSLATGDLDGDGVHELLGGGGNDTLFAFSTAGGAPTLVGRAPVFGGSPMGGISVAARDVNGDGVADVTVGAGPGSTPRVRVFDIAGASPVVIADFLAFDSDFRGGVRVAVVDFNGDGKGEIITGTGPGGGELQLWQIPRSPSQPRPVWPPDYYPFGSGYNGGIDVTAINLNPR